jgi:hypothetical protein
MLRNETPLTVFNALYLAPSPLRLLVMSCLLPQEQ